MLQHFLNEHLQHHSWYVPTATGYGIFLKICICHFPHFVQRNNLYFLHHLAWFCNDPVRKSQLLKKYNNFKFQSCLGCNLVEFSVKWLKKRSPLAWLAAKQLELERTTVLAKHSQTVNFSFRDLPAFLPPYRIPFCTRPSVPQLNEPSSSSATRRGCCCTKKPPFS